MKLTHDVIERKPWLLIALVLLVDACSFTARRLLTR